MSTSQSTSPLRSPGRPDGSSTVDLRLLRQLTTRDRFLLTLIAEHQVLTTGQLTAVAFDSPARAQHRLLTLYRLGILDRFRWHQPVGSQAWHYTLGPAGAAIIAASHGTTPPRPAVQRDRALRLATSPRLAHLLGVNNFFTRLHAQARRTLGQQLELWWSERKATAEFDQLARPDGFGRWSEHHRSVEFFLEYDTGTEPLSRLVGKLTGYADLTLAGGPAGPVLFVLPGPGREAGLQRHLRSTPVPVATTTVQDLDRSIGPAGAVWLPIHAASRLRLVDLGATGSHRQQQGTA